MSTTAMPKTITKLHNPVREYAWGSTTAIAEIQGRATPTARPEAELWIGAHPAAPSTLVVDGRERLLADVIAEAPSEILGAKVARRFAGRLPFLLKILAACEPLSIQAHPNLAQAAAGFARENAAGIPLGAPQRNYCDVNHKPEVIYALTPFHLVAGLRERAEILRLADALGLGDDLPGAAALRADSKAEDPKAEDPKAEDPAAYSLLLREWFSMPTGDPRLRRAAQLAARRGGPVAKWIRRLDAAHPGDRGILAPLLLHLVELQPGEAIFTGAGMLHAYLDGVGIELMASSDNVLRGALTIKNVDVDELLAVVPARPGSPQRLWPQPGDPGEMRFEPPVDDFLLSRLELREGWTTTHRTEGIEILLVTRGYACLRDENTTLRLTSGEAALIPAGVDSYLLSGDGEAFRATVSGR